MVVVQTFWSGEKDPLVDGYGWLHPKYNLMSWALSCLTLKENYEDVILYTDSKGYEVFHKYLKLPYKKIIIQYDDLKCHKDLWAYPKLLTYSIQNKAFIHVDGDVFLPSGLSKETESGDLIAQNLEIGTDYYKAMANQIFAQDVSFPDFLHYELKKDSISSYNAGVLGGSDLAFIKEYCDTAFKFIQDNNLADIHNKNVCVNYNIVFEQILFQCLAKKNNKTVSTVLDNPTNDNGYSYFEFCDFNYFQNKKIMHIIGGHKCNEHTCELLSRILLNKYPEYYCRIMQLFPAEFTFPGKEGNKIITSNPVFKLLDNVKLYKEFLYVTSLQWREILYEQLFKQEKRSGNYFRFLNANPEEKLSTIIKKNPYMAIYEIPQEWDGDTRMFLKDKISKHYQYADFNIVTIPELSSKGYREVIINDVCYNVLMLLQKPKTFSEIIKKIKESFPVEVKDHLRIEQTVRISLEHLFCNKIVYID